MSDQNIEILKKETYLKAIENSIGSKIFNSLFVKFKDTNKVSDILNDGEYSCAFFVSGILFLVQMVDKTAATVKSLKESIEKNSKWEKVDLENIIEGDVIFWYPFKHDDGTETPHVGFVSNKNEATSTDYKNKLITKRDIHERKIESVYRFIW